MPLVSIVIPSFNRGDIITATIESIIGQTHSNWELLIVDDGSTDNSIEVINKLTVRDKRVSLYSRPKNRTKGANSCRNFGFEKANGEYIKWVDSDDILVPDAIQKQVQLMESNPDLNVCFGFGRFFNDSTKDLEEGWARKYSSDNLLWDYIRNNVRWPVGGPLWRTKYFTSPPFKENLKNSQEWLMHGQQLIKLQPNEYHLLTEDIYLIRRGNIRMSSNRTSNYYVNSAKARWLLMINHLKSNHISSKVTIELTKQILVFCFHATRARFIGFSKP